MNAQIIWKSLNVSAVFNDQLREFIELRNLIFPSLEHVHFGFWQTEDFSQLANRRSKLKRIVHRNQSRILKGLEDEIGNIISISP